MKFYRSLKVNNNQVLICSTLSASGYFGYRVLWLRSFHSLAPKAIIFAAFSDLNRNFQQKDCGKSNKSPRKLSFTSAKLSNALAQLSFASAKLSK